MPCRVLFVEDESSVHFALREYFGALGYLVDCAADAASALARITRSPYDIVVADLRLSGDEVPLAEPVGLSLIEWLHRTHPDTRVVVLTACGLDLCEEALRLGASRFLQKPQPLSVVAEVLGSLRGPSATDAIQERKRT